MPIWEFLEAYGPRIVDGTLVTALQFVLATLVAIAVALAAGFGRLSSNFALRGIATVCIEILRGTSLLVQLCRIFFVRPLFGITLDKFWAGFLSVGLNAGSYGAELVCGAIRPVPKGQWEACRALNMSTRDTYVRIVIPQAPPTSVAGMGNDLVGIFKETPMLSVIGVAELMHTASAIGAENHRFPEPTRWWG